MTKMLSMKSVICASAVLTLLVVGVVIFAFFSSPLEKSTNIVDEVIIIKGDELKFRKFSVYSKYDHVASFTLSNGTIITCDPLNFTFYNYWWENEYSPSWYEASEGEYNYAGDYSPPNLMVPMNRYAFLFDNQDSYDKEVHVKVTSYRIEQNATNLIIASVLTLSGLFLGIGLAAKVHKDEASTSKTGLPTAAGMGSWIGIINFNKTRENSRYPNCADTRLRTISHRNPTIVKTIVESIVRLHRKFAHESAQKLNVSIGIIYPALLFGVFLEG